MRLGDAAHDRQPESPAGSVTCVGGGRPGVRVEDARLVFAPDRSAVVVDREPGRTVIPAGSVMRGVVSSVTPAGRLKRKAEMMVTFDQITINGRSYPIRGTVTQAIEGEGVKGDLPRAGVGAGVGAIIGGILGGFKGAMAGVLIGGGGTIAATEGKEVELPQGTVLRVRIESPVPL